MDKKPTNIDEKCPLCHGSGYYFSPLTREIKGLKKQGMSLRQIGKALGLSGNTVLYHLRKSKTED